MLCIEHSSTSGNLFVVGTECLAEKHICIENSSSTRSRRQDLEEEIINRSDEVEVQNYLQFLHYRYTMGDDHRQLSMAVYV